MDITLINQQRIKPEKRANRKKFTLSLPSAMTSSTTHGHRPTIKVLPTKLLSLPPPEEKNFFIFDPNYNPPRKNGGT